MKKFKRILSAALAAGMLTLITPVSVFAETLDIDGGKEYVFEPLASGSIGYVSYEFDEATGTLTYIGSNPIIDIPDGIDRSAVKEIIIEDGITSIGMNAFSGCSELKSISIPNSVTSIGDGAFYCCSGLISVVIPDSVTSIGNDAFGYSGLINIKISNSLNTIEYNTFRGCSGLINVEIPDSVTTIRDGAFNGCSRLSSVTLSENLSLIDMDAFSDCESLTSIAIPDSVKTIEDNAFENCTSLNSVTIGSGVTRIGLAAFGNCTSLESITIPENVTSIDMFAFENCIALKSVTIQGVPFIDCGAFVVDGCTFIMPYNAPELYDYKVLGFNPIIKIPYGATGYDQGAWAELADYIVYDSTCDIRDGSIRITSTGYSIGDGDEIPYTGDYLITGDFSEEVSSTITVESGNHNITIDGVNIRSGSNPFDIKPSALVNLTVSGSNKLKSSNIANAALHVPTNATLYIVKESTGTLEAYGDYGAGIGGDNDENAGFMGIYGGVITASATEGAGIGGGANGQGGIIHIRGDKVTASARAGAGIGGGIGKNGGSINIYDGIVEANSISGAGIGCGSGGAGGVFRASGNAIIFAACNGSNAISDKSGSILWNGVVYENGNGKVYGNIVLDYNFENPTGHILTVPKGTIFGISDIILMNNGTIETYCTDENTYNGVVNINHTIINVPEKAASCEKAGSLEYWKCEDCGMLFGDEDGTAEIDEIPVNGAPLGHDLGEWASDGDETHTRACQRDGCDYSETEDHDLGEWVSDGDETHTRTCNDCDYHQTENHNFGDWEITLEPTETETGMKKHTCETCGYEEEQEIDTLAHEHVYGGWVYDENGHWHECTSDICPDVESSKIDYAEHDFGDWEITLEPTETEKGLRKHSCETCGYEEEQEMDTLEHEHVYGDWVYDETGHWHECTSDICPDENKGKTDYAPHEWDDDADTDCNICGYTRTVETEPEEPEPEEPEPEPEEPEPEETEPPMSFKPVETEPKLGAYIIIETKPPVTSDIALGAGVEDEAQTKNSVGIIAAVSAALIALSAAFALKKKKEN